MKTEFGKAANKDNHGLKLQILPFHDLLVLVLSNQ